MRTSVLLLGLLLSLAITTARAETVLRVGDQKGGVQAIMAAAGELSSPPYRIEWREFEAAAPLLEALNADAIDTGFVGDAPFTFAAAAGVPIRAVGAVRWNPEGLAIVVPRESPIRSLDDLKGRRIGTGKGSIGHFLVLAALDRAGLDPGSVNLVFLTPADAKAALASGAIAAWSTWEPYTSMVELEGGRRIVDGTGLSNGVSYQVASPGAIAAKRAAIADFLEREARARLWVLQHPDDYAETWAKLMSLPAAAAKLWFERARIRPTPIDAALIAEQQRVVDLYARTGVIKMRFDISAAFDSSFNPTLPGEARSSTGR